MASFNRVTFSGSTDTISVPFGYLDKSHVVVSLGGVVLASGAYSWPSNGQVKITAGNPAAGVVGEVRRVTPATPIVNFEPGNLDTDDLDTASLQAIYIAEEAKDQTDDVDERVWYSSGFQVGGTITKGGEDVVPKFNADGDLVPGPSVSEISAAQGYATLALGYRNQAELFAAAAATFDPGNFYTKVQADARYYTKAQVNTLFADFINGSAVKTTLVANDKLAIWDSAASQNRHILWSAFREQSKWTSMKIGEVYLVNTAITGVDIPPASDPGVVFVELTAGLTGVGQFNNGKLTSESVTGSAPLVLATAVISVTGSPINGRTIDLLNTEGRILRPSASPGTKQNDQLQGFQIAIPRATSATATGASAGSSPSGFNIVLPSDDGTNGTPRVGTETRMKNVGVKAYMRVK